MKASDIPATAPLLVEIGCEEIPARFLSEAMSTFGEKLRVALATSRLLPPNALPIRTYSTPRRLVCWAPEVLTQQADAVEQLLGPPARIAFDENGKPTRAAESFAQKNSVKVKDLVIVDTPKGQYAAIRKVSSGLPATKILGEILPGTIVGLDFPKSMYWLSKEGPHFVRPIRWILAQFGEGQKALIVPLETAGIRSGDFTYGHRAVARGPIRVRGIKDYSKKLRAAHVEFDPEKRRTLLLRKFNLLLEDCGFNPLEDGELENWVVNSCEWPGAVLGEFEERFLKLPREILVTVMRGHQKYFAVEDKKGNLRPLFIAVINLAKDAKGWIRAGHERVLAARFADAEFFWNADQSLTLDKRQEQLSAVTYATDLGNYQEKVRRMKLLAGDLCASLEGQGRITATDRGMVLRAIELSKCDLTTQMVREFPELQGIVGGLYARVQGEPQAVSEAIYDHYLPQSLEGESPRKIIGAIVSLADKIDSVVGGFAVGHEPTGSSDPFALRRQGNGAIKVLLELSLPVRLKPIVEQGVNALNIQWRRPQAEVFTSVADFFEDRVRYYLAEVRKLRYDTVRAVLAAGWDPPIEALRRAEALELIRDGEDFEALFIAAKRIKNILTKSATTRDWEPGEVDGALLGEEAERELSTAYHGKLARVDALSRQGDYQAALETLAGLRPSVDRFFDQVLVMAKDRAVRQNRLRLLGRLNELFTSVADFAEIATPNVDASTSVKSNRRK